MPTRYFRTLISKISLQELKSALNSETSKAENTGKQNNLFVTQKHYFLETESAENLKEFLRDFNFVECSKPKEKIKKI